MPRTRWVAILTVWLATVPVVATAGEPFDAAEETRIRELVRETLRENPEIVLEALQILRERQRRAEAEARRQAVVDQRERLLADPDSPVGGNPKGDVTIVEFFDYRCPYCRAAFPMVRELLERDGNVRFVYKEWPILGPDSDFAARIALAVHRTAPDRYEAFHARMYESERVDRETVLAVVAELGLDPVEIERRALEDPAIEAEIREVAELADSLGISGTPAFVVGDHLIPGLPEAGMLERLVETVRRRRAGGEEG